MRYKQPKYAKLRFPIYYSIIPSQKPEIQEVPEGTVVKVLSNNRRTNKYIIEIGDHRQSVPFAMLDFLPEGNLTESLYL